ncbi:unnamed protein product [Angiostrongylus costaricensis]|uniref:Thiosulfate sulfurtransferase n=1 Tax=Angiostrongylus costaricensis TaxID=334426 RepID=A0A0R3PCK5_ANGCS|nr:unnamed protein product [Angiostrongylus costaricensis]
MSLKRFIDVTTVSQLLKKNIINKEGVRLLDCSYCVGQKPDWKDFKKHLYGKFEKILALPSLSKELYLSGHIPEAVHITLDAAVYPSKYERFALYPPELFEKYIQMVGINSGEHIILYSRGSIGGMMYSSKFAWLFKSYGHGKLSVVDGGFDQWKKSGFEVSKADVQLPHGNWKAKDDISLNNIKFEEMEAKEGGKQYMDQTDKINFIDSRIRGQFNGTEDTGLDPYRVAGSNIPGFKNIPAAELIDEKGVMKNPEEIRQWLYANGYRQDQPVVTMCNTGMQAAMLAYAVDTVLPGVSPRVYNGSMKEMEIRDPKKISGGKKHLSH